MRKRYREQGLDGFADHEVLELLLYYCYPQRDTNEIAHKILREFKTLPQLFDANVDTIMARLGCTENIAVLLNLMPAIAKRYLSRKWGEKVILQTPEAAGEFCMNLFVGEQVECVYIICLDTGMRVMQTCLIARGTVDEVAVFIREIVRKVIENQAASIILVHNHPGGTIRPSLDDNALTTRVRDALELIDVRVNDHIIVADNKYFSFAQRNSAHVDGF